MNRSSLGCVSVVVPAIRFDDYLRLAIESLLVQEIDRLEIVLVLDGILDEEYPTWVADPAIKIVPLFPRKGTPAALNAGLDMATGEFVARLDADDLAFPGRLVAQQAFLVRERDVDCVASDVRLIDSNGIDIGMKRSPEGWAEIARSLLSSNCIVHSSVMYRASAIRKIGGYAPDMLRMQDYELFLRLAVSGRIASLAAPYSGYRVHLGQHSRRSVPWSRYTLKVLRRRSELARALGEIGVAQVFRNAYWFTGQIVRHLGFVKPGYLRRAAR